MREKGEAASGCGHLHECFYHAISTWIIAEQVEESDRARARGAAGAEQGDHATWNAVYAAASKLLALARQCDSRVALGLQQHDGQVGLWMNDKKKRKERLRKPCPAADG
eukprot:1138859-Pelagomonas_calceolata.AAC.8